jgi:very-short-patch-repair endonuclease
MVDISAHRRGERDREIARVAAGQHGLVTLRQLEAMGVARSAVHKRIAAGRLHRVHDGVYAVGHRVLTRHGNFLAAVLAGGPDAVLSHRSAAELWGLLDGEGDAPLDVTAPHRRGRTPPGISAHRDGSLRPADRTRRNRIPCTSVARTLLDLAAVVPVPKLRRALAEAEVLRVLDRSALREVIRRGRGRRGVARLRLLLEELDPKTKWTRSEMERAFLRMCRRGGLPEPEVNVRLTIGGKRLEPDFLWRDAGLIVEADSRTFHDTYSAFSDDRKREQQLQLAGWRVSRCTWAQIQHEPRSLSETIHALLPLKPMSMGR